MVVRTLIRLEGDNIISMNYVLDRLGRELTSRIRVVNPI